MYTVLTVAAGAALCSLVSAQTGTSRRTDLVLGEFRNACISANMTSTFRGLSGVTTNFAIKVNTGSTARVICGMELRCARTAGLTTVNVSIYDATAAGAPGKSLGSSTMVVGTAVANYRALFATPLILVPNQDFFLVLNNSSGLRLPIGTGTNRPTTTAGRRRGEGPFTSVAWNYSVLCCGTAAPPAISNTGAPTIGKSFSQSISPRRRVASTSAVDRSRANEHPVGRCRGARMHALHDSDLPARGHDQRRRELLTEHRYAPTTRA